MESTEEFFERFNKQPWTWEPIIDGWETDWISWRKANPGYPKNRKQRVDQAVCVKQLFTEFVADEPTSRDIEERFGERKQDPIKRKDRYNITIYGFNVRATNDQESAIRNLNSEQLDRFRRIMGDE